MPISDEEARKIMEARDSQFNTVKEVGEVQSLPTSNVPPPKPKEKKAFATHAEQTLLAAVVKFGNNYQLAKLAGITPDILSRFARQERTLRLDKAGKVAAALGLKLQ